MNVNILSIGKFKRNSYYKALFEEYKKRISWQCKLKELNITQKFSGKDIKTTEGKILLANRSKKSKLIVLDERGKNITSPRFAKLIESYQLDGFNDIDFIIGGSEGLSEEVRNNADYVLSFGLMVFPHLMVRVMLMEQIYRAFTILKNHPYHK